MKIVIIGSGYVGLTTGACLAEMGNKVICVDNNEEKICALKNGRVPFYEPGLAELVRSNVAEDRLSFSASIAQSVDGAKVIFICVGTPPLPDGTADVSALMRVGKEVAAAIKDYAVIVEKSTVPAGTADAMRKLMEDTADRKKFDVAVNPEFLREGTAIHDSMNPDRIVIGSQSARADATLTELYKPLNSPLFFMSLPGAELTKHLSNAMLATRISFANSAALAAEKVDADVVQIMRAVGMDKRIGPAFLKAGVGFGGFCFPKDLDALISLYKKLGIDASLLEGVRDVNRQQRQHFVNKAEKILGGLDGKTIAVLGLAFKPNTDDMRLAPSIDIIRALVKKGAAVRAYDPQAMENAKQHLPGITYCPDSLEAIDGADALMILTEWNEFKNLDLTEVKKRLKAPVLLDGRNVFSPARMRMLGFTYAGVGRGLNRE